MAPGSLVPWVPVLGGMLLVLGTVWQGQPGLGTVLAQELLIRQRLQPGFFHAGWARAEDLHTQSILNLVLSLYSPLVWTADSLSLCPTSGYFRS